jgi:hypothetical protein
MHASRRQNAQVSSPRYAASNNVNTQPVLIFSIAIITTSAIGGAIAWVAGLQASRRFSQVARLNGYRLLLAMSLVPYGFFLWHMVQYTTRSVTYPQIGTLGHYPGVTAYFAFGALLAAVLFSLAAAVARRWSVLASLLPTAVFFGHRTLVSDWLNYEVPTGGPKIVLRDDAPAIAFFVISIAATISLVVFAWFALSERSAA